MRRIAMNKTYNDFADIFLAVKRIESDYASLVTGLAESMEEIERLNAAFDESCKENDSIKHELEWISEAVENAIRLIEVGWTIPAEKKLIDIRQVLSRILSDKKAKVTTQ